MLLTVWRLALHCLFVVCFIASQHTLRLQQYTTPTVYVSSTLPSLHCPALLQAAGKKVVRAVHKINFGDVAALAMQNAARKAMHARAAVGDEDDEDDTPVRRVLCACTCAV